MFKKSCLTLALSIFMLAGFPAACLAGPCDLITQSEARQILGEAVKPPRLSRITMGSGQGCAYYTAAPLSVRGGVGVVRLNLFTPQAMNKPGSLFASPKQYFEKRMRASRNAKAKIEEIKGLGDKAFWISGSDRLHVLAKGCYLVLSVRPLKKMQAKSRAALDAAISAYRRDQAVGVMQKYVLPKLN